MSVKEIIANKLVDEGYDFVTALELATKCLEEARTRGPGQYTYHTDKLTITFMIKETK